MPADVSPVSPAIRLVVPDPARCVHAHAFDEVILTLTGGLQRLGIEARTTYDCHAGPEPVLVLAPHLHDLADLAALPPDSILYTWEPMGWSHTVFMTEALIDTMRRFIVWDYSLRNIQTWRALGARRVVHAAVAWDPTLEHLSLPRGRKDIDVLFYGSLSARRREVLQRLSDDGLSVQVLFSVYGAERDAWIGRSKLVLNLHVHEGQILELPRLGFLWSNRVPVVCEINAATEDSLGMAPFALAADYVGLPAVVHAALADQALLERSVTDCYREIRSRGDSRVRLARALAESARLASGSEPPLRRPGLRQAASLDMVTGGAG